MRKFAMDCIMQAGANLENIEFYFHETNDAWCRDHGPAFLINKNGEEPEETYRDWETDRKSTRLNSSHSGESRMPSSA